LKLIFFEVNPQLDFAARNLFKDTITEMYCANHYHSKKNDDEGPKWVEEKTNVLFTETVPKIEKHFGLEGLKAEDIKTLVKVFQGCKIRSGRDRIIRIIAIIILSKFCQKSSKFSSQTVGIRQKSRNFIDIL